MTALIQQKNYWKKQKKKVYAIHLPADSIIADKFAADAECFFCTKQYIFLMAGWDWILAAMACDTFYQSDSCIQKPFYGMVQWVYLKWKSFSMVQKHCKGSSRSHPEWCILPW